MTTKPRVKSCREVARTRLFKVEELKLEFVNGAQERLRNHTASTTFIL